MDMDMAPDLSEDSANLESYLQVATVFNSRFYKEKDFEGVQASTNFALSSSSIPKTSQLWGSLKAWKPEEVVLRCDFETLLVPYISSYFDA